MNKKQGKAQVRQKFMVSDEENLLRLKILKDVIVEYSSGRLPDSRLSAGELGFQMMSYCTFYQNTTQNRIQTNWIISWKLSSERNDNSDYRRT
jgi:hypothetical protein